MSKGPVENSVKVVRCLDLGRVFVIKNGDPPEPTSQTRWKGDKERRVVTKRHSSTLEGVV